ncbi:5426_t:CDS:2 [Entrophospora sp. SA101]|nr:11926_t:CDS:2 [Entrophospora sp. SA101]CAJ0753979.1 21124_t:CDS:2 [Entrophospora sp. SA101]CAJ0761923.1 5426_t:CDS:2 [Entrophospora sp. SA101]CAJ0870121.1 10818_t:CDS:2 [Entrophospora sp. SA101]
MSFGLINAPGSNVHGLGTVSAQVDDNSKEHVISYANNSLLKEQKNYGATELAFGRSVGNRILPSLLLQLFILVTNHSRLKEEGYYEFLDCII